MRAFLILHGWDNHRPPGHWQHELATALRSRGERVEYPQLPSASSPSLAGWRDAAGVSLRAAAADGAEVTVICHSLACLLWLGARPADAAVSHVLLVAPPSREVVAGIPEIASFAAVDPARPAMATTIVASDDDPFCPEGAQAAYGAPLGIPVQTIPGGGHLELTAGYGEWPSMLAWCFDPTTTLQPR